VSKTASGKTPDVFKTAVPGECVCGKVRIEIDFPAHWAWHDHSAASLGEALVPLKGFPGVVWDRSKRKKRPQFGGIF